MQIDLEKINKLPPDVRDRFKKILVKYKEEDKKELAQKDFLTFTKTIWPEFIGTHLEELVKIAPSREPLETPIKDPVRETSSVNGYTWTNTRLTPQ